MILYFCAQRLVRTLWPLVGGLEIEGLDRIPARGAFLLISNHQSVLDPLLIQAVCPRPVYTMAKSTQFSGPVFGWLMPRLCSFPVRRYRIDPQAVRFALRRLAEGHPVGIYIEGERTWDGRLQPPRLGTVRLILKAGVPVLPCTIQGTYEVWPRWQRSLRRGTVRITFGDLLTFPKLDRRAEREAALEEAASRLMSALASPLDVEWPAPAEVTAGAK